VVGYWETLDDLDVDDLLELLAKKREEELERREQSRGRLQESLNLLGDLVWIFLRMERPRLANPEAAANGEEPRYVVELTKEVAERLCVAKSHVAQQHGNPPVELTTA